MRQQLLRRTVTRFLEPGEEVEAAAYMWVRHPQGIVWATGAGAIAAAIAAVGGGELPVMPVVFGLLAASIVYTVTTQYRVLAVTNHRMVMCRGGRIRQVATGLIGEVQTPTIEPVGGSMLATDWKVDDVTYSVSKSYEKAIHAIALGGPY